MHGILADANCAGHLALLLRLFQVGWRHDVWEGLHLTLVSFADLGLQPEASDRGVWEICSVSTLSCSPPTAMMTALNRSKPPSSNTTRLHSLPVFTLANDQRVLRDRLMPKRSLIGCLSICLTLIVIAGLDDCTCPNDGCNSIPLLD